MRFCFVRVTLVAFDFAYHCSMRTKQTLEELFFRSLCLSTAAGQKSKIFEHCTDLNVVCARASEKNDRVFLAVNSVTNVVIMIVPRPT